MLIATAPAMKRLCISNSVPLRTSMNALKNKYERVIKTNTSVLKTNTNALKNKYERVKNKYERVKEQIRTR